MFRKKQHKTPEQTEGPTPIEQRRQDVVGKEKKEFAHLATKWTRYANEYPEIADMILTRDAIERCRRRISFLESEASDETLKTYIRISERSRHFHEEEMT